MYRVSLLPWGRRQLVVSVGLKYQPGCFCFAYFRQYASRCEIHLSASVSFLQP